MAYVPGLKMDQDLKNIGAACHEAGHLLVAMVLGMEVQGAWLANDVSGVAFLVHDAFDPVEQVRALIATLAGVEASIELYRRIQQDYSEEVYGEGHDQFEANLLTMALLQQPGVFPRRVLTVARRLLRANWAHVARLATTLHDRPEHRVTAEEVPGLLAEAGPVDVRIAAWARPFLPASHPFPVRRVGDRRRAQGGGGRGTPRYPRGG